MFLGLVLQREKVNYATFHNVHFDYVKRCQSNGPLMSDHSILHSNFT